MELSPRQTQIILYEISELELEDSVKEFIKAGGDFDRLESSNPLTRKFDEMRGMETKKNEELKFTAEELKMIEKMKREKKVV